MLSGFGDFLTTQTARESLSTVFFPYFSEERDPEQTCSRVSIKNRPEIKFLTGLRYQLIL